MADIVSLRDNQIQVKCSLTKREFYIIIDTVYMSPSLNVDHISALQYLKRHGCINERKYKDLLVMFDHMQGSQQDRNVKLLLEMGKSMSFADIVRFLCHIEQKEFAKDIWRQRFGERVFFLFELDIAVSRNTLKFFNALKRNMDDGNFKDRKQVLEYFTNCLKQKFESAISLHNKQELVNQYAIVTYQRVALYRPRSTREKILQEMLDSSPRDVNLTLVKIVYFSKMSVTAIHANDEDSATRFITQAVELTQAGYPQDSAWVKGLVWHDHQYLSRCLGSVSPCEKHVKNTFTGGQCGLDVMQTYTPNDSDIMVKIFRTEMAMALLNINKDFLVDTIVPVGEDDKQKAEQLLNSLERNNERLEIRRAMIVSLCRAKICENFDLDAAKSYARRALELAPEGTHFPNQIINIEKYHSYLQTKTCREN